MNVPQLRFDGFDGEWKNTTIKNEVIFFGNKRKPVTENLRKKGIYPYYGATGVIDYVEDYVLDGEFLLLAEDGANILTRSAPLVYKTEGKFWVNNHAHVLKPKESNDFNFFYQLLESINYVPYNSGTAQPKLNLENVKKIPLIIPSYGEQQKIGSFFTLLTQKIEKQQEKIEKLEQFKKGIMQKIFSQKLRFKDEDGGEFGEWEESQIGDFIINYIEKTVVNNQYPVLTSSRKGLVFQKDHFKNRQVTTEENKGYHIIPKGYFTYRSRSDDGKFFFNRNTIIDKGIVSYFYPVFNTNNINPDYFLIYINNYLAKEILIEIVGTSQLVLSLNKFKKLRIVVPETKEQEKIGNFFSKIELKIEKEKEKLMVFEEQKKGFMQGMFV